MHPIDDASRDAILDDLRAGGKIAAIKRYRQITGAGLATAKRDVESLMRENGIVDPAIRVNPIALIGVLFVLALVAIALMRHGAPLP